MNKTELITAMAEASGLTKKDCDTALNAFVDTLQTALKPVTRYSCWALAPSR